MTATPAPLPQNEGIRMAALHRAKILDTDPERGFDDLVRLAAYICQTPISLVSLVDSERQWFKAKVGLDATETSREVSFCAHAILGDGLFVVPDATRDERFANNPLVTGDPRIRFYAGAPLYSVEGQPLGTLCVIDTSPREIQPHQEAALSALARLARDQLQLRENIVELHKLMDRVKTLGGLIPVCAWCRQVRTDSGYWAAVEDYVEQHADVQFTDCLCPSCVGKALAKLRGGREPAAE